MLIDETNIQERSPMKLFIWKGSKGSFDGPDFAVVSQLKEPLVSNP
jgi:hypothetical protein